MKYRALFKDSSFIVQIMVLLALFVVGVLISTVIMGIYMLSSGIPMDRAVTDPEIMRITQFITSFLSFLAPALVAAYLFSDKPSQYLQLNKPEISVALLTIVSVLAFLPFLNLTVYFNEKMVLPDSLKMLENWMREKEDAATEITRLMLQTDHWGIQVFNVLLFGVMAGVGEEFLFRGTMQRVFEKIYRNPHAVIWIVAFVFSFIHIQFYGFIPRMLLGAFMGYLLLWTKSLWIAVLAHFTNNTFSVLANYFSPDPETYHALDTLGTGNTIWLAGVSLVLGVVCCLLIRRIATAAKSYA